MNCEYYERQRSPWTLFILLVVLVEIGLPLVIPLPFVASVVMMVCAGVVTIIGFAFAELILEDNGESLRVRFGPLPLAATQIDYSEIISVTQERSTIFDGWGLRRTRGGWLWNIWGFDCIAITTKTKTVRVGTQQPTELLQFLLLKANQ